jgi:hypothetical protein
MWHGPPQILGGCHGFHVRRIAAPLIAAEMVNLEVGGDRPNH